MLFLFLLQTEHTPDSEKSAYSIFSLPEDLCPMLLGNDFGGFRKNITSLSRQGDDGNALYGGFT